MGKMKTRRGRNNGGHRTRRNDQIRDYAERHHVTENQARELLRNGGRTKPQVNSNSANEPVTSAVAADLKLPLEELDLTVRAYNLLMRSDVNTIGDLVAKTKSELLDIKNFGTKLLDEVEMKLAGMGLALKRADV